MLRGPASLRTRDSHFWHHLERFWSAHDAKNAPTLSLKPLERQKKTKQTQWINVKCEMTSRLRYSTTLGRVEGYAVFLWAIVMRVPLPATLVPPPAPAQGRKKTCACQADEREKRCELKVVVLTVAAYTKPWRERNRSRTTPAPWWPSACGLSRPRRAGRRARTASRRSLGGTCNRARKNETLPHRSDIYTQKKPQLTHTQASPPGSGNDKCREDRNVGGNLDIRRNGTRLQPPQTLSGLRNIGLKSYFGV